jgi:hypothetical protein
MVWVIVFNATFNNISAVSWRSVFVWRMKCNMAYSYWEQNLPIETLSTTVTVFKHVESGVKHYNPDHNTSVSIIFYARYGLQCPTQFLIIFQLNVTMNGWVPLLMDY